MCQCQRIQHVSQNCWKLEIPINWLVLLVDLASTKKYGDLIPAKTENMGQDQRLKVVDHLKQ